MMELTNEAVNQRLRRLASSYSKELRECLGEDLVSVVLFGSVARGEASFESDVDLLIIARNLPRGQFARKDRLCPADEKVAPVLEELSRTGIDASFSRIVKTPEEAEKIVPLYLDLVEDAVLLVDRKDFFGRILSQLRNRLQELGARRIVAGKIRYWDLKPDLQPFERFSI